MELVELVVVRTQVPLAAADFLVELVEPLETQAAQAAGAEVA